MFEAALVTATVLCGLVAGLLSGFAVVVMPGISSLPDRAFVRSFQVMDRVIQNNQPLFILMWAGSVVSLVAAVVLGLAGSDGRELGFLLGATAVYLLGVQLPTFAINIPLNNRLQEVDAHAESEPELARARKAFEARWNTWNRIRAALSLVTTVLLAISLTQL